MEAAVPTAKPAPLGLAGAPGELDGEIPEEGRRPEFVANEPLGHVGGGELGSVAVEPGRRPELGGWELPDVGPRVQRVPLVAGPAGGSGTAGSGPDLAEAARPGLLATGAGNCWPRGS